MFHRRQKQQDPPPDANRLEFDPTPEQIVSACPDAVLETVAVNWPLIRDALVAEGFSDPATFLAAIATTYVETHIGDFTFKPIKEFGGVAYFTANYEDNREIARQLGNTQPGDGARYCGRGYIQITGRANYRNYGKVLGVPLEDNPDLALEPDVAARIMAAYFAGRGIPDRANTAIRFRRPGLAAGAPSRQRRAERLQLVSAGGAVCSSRCTKLQRSDAAARALTQNPTANSCVSTQGRV